MSRIFTIDTFDAFLEPVPKVKCVEISRPYYLPEATVLNNNRQRPHTASLVFTFMQHSSSYSNISYIARNSHTCDSPSNGSYLYRTSSRFSYISIILRSRDFFNFHTFASQYTVPHPYNSIFPNRSVTIVQPFSNITTFPYIHIPPGLPFPAPQSPYLYNSFASVYTSPV